MGIIIDKELGDCQGAATNGLFKLQNIYMANADAIGTDNNKVLTDPDNSSFSAKFFLAQPGNVYSATANGWFDVTGYRPMTGSPLLTAASFTDTLLQGFDKVSYIGAFGNGSDRTANWTNFDPQNIQY